MKVILRISKNKNDGNEDCASDIIFEGMKELCGKVGMKMYNCAEFEDGSIVYEFNHWVTENHEKLTELTTLRNKLNREIATLKKANLKPKIDTEIIDTEVRSCCFCGETFDSHGENYCGNHQ